MSASAESIRFSCSLARLELATPVQPFIVRLDTASQNDKRLLISPPVIELGDRITLPSPGVLR